MGFITSITKDLTKAHFLWTQTRSSAPRLDQGVPQVSSLGAGGPAAGTPNNGIFLIGNHSESNGNSWTTGCNTMGCRRHWASEMPPTVVSSPEKNVFSRHFGQLSDVWTHAQNLMGETRSLKCTNLSFGQAQVDMRCNYVRICPSADFLWTNCRKFPIEFRVNMMPLGLSEQFLYMEVS